MMGNVINRFGISVSGMIYGVVPKDDLAGIVDSGNDFYHGGRAEGVIEEFLGPCEADLDRLASLAASSASLLGFGDPLPPNPPPTKGVITRTF